ncbi:hypothetical protein [Fundicoccus culcitae]|uniref:DUF4064 domain-containing protein n=1 Tax=Fundicoccus culcitae TaxID=2969821 RepID=A0ABY5P9Q0_9LACT|nr:hypothetical protein [Fundicoccus culcitae]UUX35389.1 hypothetical protein NRE15_07015 [Fundicoccus culcitae]
MTRTLERNILRFGAVWNLVNGLITIIGFGSQIRVDGIQGLSDATMANKDLVGSLIDSVFMVVMAYGLLQIAIGVLNFVVVRNMRDNKIQKGFIIWLAILMILSLITMDIIGTLIYVVLFVLYLSRNKAIRLQKQLQYQNQI